MLYEGEHRKNKTSWKQQIRDAIDELIPSVQNLNELLSILEERGYEIKLGKYISIKAPGQQRAIRAKTLGEEYAEEYLNARILYHDVGTGDFPPPDKRSQLWEAYASIIGDVRFLAEQSRKVPRKQNMIMQYSADNDLDIFKLSAQMSVLSKEKIGSVGELEGRIAYVKTEYERHRTELNAIIEEHNRFSILLEQANTYYWLEKKESLPETEQLQKTVCMKAMDSGGILYRVDYDRLRNKVESLDKKISAHKKKLDEVQKKYEVYRDILETFFEVSKDEYITKLEEEKRLRKEKLSKKKKKLKR